MEGVRLMIQRGITNSLVSEKPPKITFSTARVNKNMSQIDADAISTPIPGVPDLNRFCATHRRVEEVRKRTQAKITRNMRKRKEMLGAVTEFTTEGDPGSTGRAFPMSFKKDGVEHKQEMLITRTVKTGNRNLGTTVIDACLKEVVEEMQDLILEALGLPPMEEDVDEHGVPLPSRFDADCIAKLKAHKVKHTLPNGTSTMIDAYTLLCIRLKTVIDGKYESGEMRVTTTKFTAVCLDHDKHSKRRPVR